jgi:hypothetical protein
MNSFRSIHHFSWGLREPALQASAPAGGGGPTRSGPVSRPELSLPADQERVDPLTDLPFDQAAGAGGRLKLVGYPQVLGAPAPERAHRLNPRAGAAPGIAVAGKCSFHRLKERVLCHPPQLGNRLGQPGSRARLPTLGHGRAMRGTPFAAVSCHGGPPKHPARAPDQLEP